MRNVHPWGRSHEPGHCWSMRKAHVCVLALGLVAAVAPAAAAPADLARAPLKPGSSTVLNLGFTQHGAEQRDTDCGVDLERDQETARTASASSGRST
jgi:hypothetical protein